MDLKLEGKIALVTGGASGIGRATVELFVAEGANVCIADRDGVAAQQTLALLNRHRQCAIAVEGDLVEEKNCERVVQETIRAFGKLDILVNNAGVNDFVPLESSSVEFMDSVRRNLAHVHSVTRFSAEHLKRARGAIVNVTSKVAVTGQSHTSGYAAAKGGVNALTREWALELAAHGVRVNCVAPAECWTPLYERRLRATPDPAAARRAIEQLIPLGRRMTTPEEIAAMIVFLASERSAHTTGQIIYVDGGYTHLDRAINQRKMLGEGD